MLPSTSFHWSEVNSQGQSRFKGRGLHKAENTDRYDSMGVHLCTHSHMYQSGKARLCCSNKPTPKSHCLKTWKFRPLLSFEMAHTLWNVFLLMPLCLTRCPILCLWNVSSAQLLSCVQLIVTPWTAACQISLSITNSQSLLKLRSFELLMLSNHLILCHPLLLLPSIFPSIRVFSNELALHIRWPKYWSFSLASVLPMNIQDWFPLGWTG